MQIKHETHYFEHSLQLLSAIEHITVRRISHY